MKIGLSYSRCVRDIVDGVVDIADVLFLSPVQILIRTMTTSGGVSGLAMVVVQTMNTAVDSSVKVILNGPAITMKIVSVV